jgi:hypothetical protein
LIQSIHSANNNIKKLKKLIFKISPSKISINLPESKDQNSSPAKWISDKIIYSEMSSKNHKSKDINLKSTISLASQLLIHKSKIG